MNIPLEIFLSFIGLSIATGLMGLLSNLKQKIPLTLFIAGSMITFLAVITDNIIMGKIPESSTTVGSTTTYVMVDNPYEFTQWVKILFALTGSMIMMLGALIWKQEEHLLDV